MHACGDDLNTATLARPTSSKATASRTRRPRSRTCTSLKSLSGPHGRGAETAAAAYASQGFPQDHHSAVITVLEATETRPCARLVVRDSAAKAQNWLICKQHPLEPRSCCRHSDSALGVCRLQGIRSRYVINPDRGTIAQSLRIETLGQALWLGPEWQ
jgi:hypothetical protein